MASDAYAVSPAELTATSGKLRAAAGSIAAELSTCAGQVRALSGVWTGGSHARYEALFTEWQTSAARLQQALEGIAEMTTAPRRSTRAVTRASRACCRASSPAQPLPPAQESAGISSHHWHHQSPPTSTRIFGCQQ